MNYGERIRLFPFYRVRPLIFLTLGALAFAEVGSFLGAKTRIPERNFISRHEQRQTEDVRVLAYLWERRGSGQTHRYIDIIYGDSALVIRLVDLEDDLNIEGSFIVHKDEDKLRKRYGIH
jgi:hypothetical protein